MADPQKTDHAIIELSSIDFFIGFEHEAVERHWFIRDGIMDGIFFVGNICNAIQVCDRGLKVRVFTLIRPWRFIPWSENTGIGTSPLIWHRDRLVWVIKVKKLTYWHKRLCYAYRVGYQPGIIITPYVQNRFELLDMVQKKIDEKITGLEI